LLKNNNYKF